jgi:hypothetical protein
VAEDAVVIKRESGLLWIEIREDYFLEGGDLKGIMRRSAGEMVPHHDYGLQARYFRFWVVTERLRSPTRRLMFT